MKTILPLFFLLIASSSFAQSETENITTEEIISAQETIGEAEETYQRIEEQLAENRSERKELQNQLEEARINLRQARLAKMEAEKRANPMTEDRYEVIANPIFEEMSMGVNHGYSVFLPNTETSGMISLFSKNVDNEFKSYMKNYKVDRVRNRRGEMFFDNIQIQEISSTPMDVYADFIERENGTTMKAYLNLGDRFLDFSRTSSAVANAKNIFDHFARYIRKSNLEGTLEDQEDKLKDLEKELNDRKKAISDAKKEINQAETTMAESMNNIDTIQSQVDQLKNDLERTRLQLSKVD